MPQRREYVRESKSRNLIWTKLADFPDYSISERGKIRCDITGLILKERVVGGEHYVTLEGGSAPLRPAGMERGSVPAPVPLRK